MNVSQTAPYTPTWPGESLVAALALATATGTTREVYIQTIRDVVLSYASVYACTLTDTEKGKLAGVKLTYGAGAGTGARGVCYYAAWKNGAGDTEYIDICASGEDSLVQLAGTTVHELGHVLAGCGEGHNNNWKTHTKRLGLQHVEAAGQDYRPDHFASDLWALIDAIPKPSDGAPLFATRSGFAGYVGLPVGRGKRGACGAGKGTRGGKSFGPGSGRMRLYTCTCETDNKVRVGHERFDATCNKCDSKFTLDKGTESN